MNTQPQISKRCYRCDNVVRMTAEQYRADQNEHTICAVCRDRLETEARFAGSPIPSPEEAEALSPKNPTDY